MVWQNDVETVKVTKILLSMRTVFGGYIGGSGGIDLSSYIYKVSIGKAQGLINITLRNSEGWGVTNNTPIVGTCNISYVVS